MSPWFQRWTAVGLSLIWLMAQAVAAWAPTAPTRVVPDAGCCRVCPCNCNGSGCCARPQPSRPPVSDPLPATSANEPSPLLGLALTPLHLGTPFLPCLASPAAGSTPAPSASAVRVHARNCTFLI